VFSGDSAYVICSKQQEGNSEGQWFSSFADLPEKSV